MKELELADAELVARYAAGGAPSEAAFAEIVRRHGGLVLAACRRQLGDAAAEDAAQATFMLLARKARSLSKREALAGWLYGAAGLIARRHLRAAGRRQRAEREAAVMRENDRHEAWGVRHEDLTSQVSRLMPELDAALAALPRHYRDAVILAKMEGRPEAEVARELGLPAGTVKSRVSRGLEMLRERLAQRGAVLSAAGLGAVLVSHGTEAVPAALAAKLAALGTAGAATAVAGGSALSAAMLKGALQAMFWTKVKIAAAVVVAAATVSTAVPLTVAAVRGAEPPAAVSNEKGIECRVTSLIPGGKVLLSAGTAQGVKEKFEFDVSRDGKPVGAVKVVVIEEKQCTAEIASATGEIKVGDTARTRFAEVTAQPANGEKPPPADIKAGIAWGEAANGLRIGLVPRGSGAAVEWKDENVCPRCAALPPPPPMDPTPLAPCAQCGTLKLRAIPAKICSECAKRERACRRCGAARPWGTVFLEGEPIRLDLLYRNTSARDMKLLNVNDTHAVGYLTFTAKAGGALWIPVYEPGGKMSELPMAVAMLAKGEQTSLELSTDSRWWAFREAGKSARLKSLPPGKYTVTASYEHAAGHAQEEICPYWHGKVATGAVEIEIKAKGAAGEAPAGNVTAALLGDPARWPRCSVVYDDMQFMGGCRVEVQGSGKVKVTTAYNRTKKDYELALDEKDVQALFRLCAERNVLAVKGRTGPGVPEEGHPDIRLTNADGKAASTTKWAHEKIPDFDEVEKALKNMIALAQKDKPVTEGPWPPPRQPAPPSK